MILHWLQQPFLPTPRHVLEEEEVRPLFVGAKPQVLLAPRNVIFTKDLVLMQITAVLHAVFRETPEPTGGGGIKQPSRWQFAHLSTRCFNKSSVPGGYWTSRSVFPHHSSAAPTGPRLLMADGRPTKSYGCRTLPLQFGNRGFQFPFLLALMDNPILGADFLAEFDLLVDPARRQVLEGSTLKPPSSPVVSTADSSIAFMSKLAPDVSALLHEFLAAWNPRPPDQLPGHQVRHKNETESQPLYAHSRRLDQVKLNAAKAEFQKMESAGIIRCSDSPWASPLHMVLKPDGSWRPCGDYRRLNNVTRPDRYPLPNLRDFTNNLKGCMVFSKLDLVKGYHQVPMDPADVCKSAIVTLFGLFEFLSMPLGLKNAAQTFQHLMDRIF